jgi:hypothetical protein
MKVGAENKPVLIGAIVCAVLAVVFVARAVMQMREATPPPAPRNAATQGPQARRVRGAATAQLPKTNSLDPTLRLDLLKSSEDVEYKGTGRNIFAAEAEPIPKPVQQVMKQPEPPKMVCPGDPACPKPPIPLKFYGFASKPGEPKKIFLSSGDDVFVAAEGEIVNRRYRVLHIGVNSVEIEDVLQNNRQTIPLTQG